MSAPARLHMMPPLQRSRTCADPSYTCLVTCRTSILRAGGLSACLSYIDFFSTSLQRVAATIAANMCRAVPDDCFHMVYDMVPNLTSLLQYQGMHL